MPLRLMFHLALDSVIMTTVWVEEENRLRVTRIEGGGRIAHELKKHADEANLTPDSIWGPAIEKDNEAAWIALEHYDTLQDAVKSRVDEAFAELFDHLDIEKVPGGGVNRNWGEIRIFMRKPDDTHTKTRVWKDSLVWAQGRITP